MVPTGQVEYLFPKLLLQKLGSTPIYSTVAGRGVKYGCIAAILNPLPIMPSKLSSPTLMTYSTKMFLDETELVFEYIRTGVVFNY